MFSGQRLRLIFSDIWKSGSFEFDACYCMIKIRVWLVLFGMYI